MAENGSGDDLMVPKQHIHDVAVPKQVITH